MEEILMQLKNAVMAAILATTALSPLGVSAQEVKKIGLAVSNLQADYFNQIKIGVEAYAAELGIEVITVDAKNDSATQVSQVQDLLTQEIDAFIYIPAGAAAAAVPTKHRATPSSPPTTPPRPTKCASTSLAWRAARAR
jgi:ribose transport system substrate-binding protein